MVPDSIAIVEINPLDTSLQATAGPELPDGDWYAGDQNIWVISENNSPRFLVVDIDESSVTYLQVILDDNLSRSEGDEMKNHQNPVPFEIFPVVNPSSHKKPYVVYP